MENASSDDEVRPRLTAFFYSVAATVIDAVLLYFVFVLQGGPIDASGTPITIISAGLLFPCVAGIFVSIF